MSNLASTLLVLAASTNQLEAIRTAKRLGYRVITLDNVPSNPGHALADRSHDVDTTDLEGVLQVAQNERISGILAACTDVAVPTVAYVAEKLGLPGFPLASARILTSKIQFRRLLAEHHLPHPRALPVSQDSELADDWFSIRPWILKPDRSSGCKGTFIVSSKAEFRARLPETLAFSANHAAVLEEFLVGRQGTFEGVLRDGRVTLSFLLDRQTAPPPYATTMGHLFPSRLPLPAQEKLIQLVESVFHRLNIRHTVFDCDFVATADEVYLLEMSPRAGGNSISGLLRRATGIDLMEYAVRWACGNIPDVPKATRLRAAAVLLLGVEEFGKLQYDHAQMLALRGENWVDSLTLDLPLGAAVRPYINSRNLVGEAFLFGTSREDLDAKVVQFRGRLDLRATADALNLDEQGLALSHSDALAGLVGQTQGFELKGTT